MPDLFTFTDAQKTSLEKEKEGQIIDTEGKDVHKLEGHSHSPFASYCLFPDKVKFVNTDAQEKIVLLLRRHPITNLPWIFVSIVLFIAPSFFPLLPFLDGLPAGFETILTLIFYLMTIAFVLEKFMDWFFNVNLITDERIFDVDFLNLMYREITEADLDQVQDVTVEVGGGIRTLFNYGNVLIETAAETPRIEFNAVPFPDRVAKVLRELGIQEEVEKLEGRIR